MDEMQLSPTAADNIPKAEVDDLLRRKRKVEPLVDASYAIGLTVERSESTKPAIHVGRGRSDVIWPDLARHASSENILSYVITTLLLQKGKT